MNVSFAEERHGIRRNKPDPRTASSLYFIQRNPKGFKYLALTFGTLLSSQGTDASIETPSGFSGRFPSSCSSLSDPLGATAFPIPR
ncbi:hypothetical protein C7M71_003165 [Peterkaempfera bronchialis]|uniref:Uncharacterized protein n=1 Tax=Peterkaempfera bronchialis TaxID=2126346 RepID=A0A345SSB0_9ACTN|nr:hypothetical protein C7M71_003165 [Peterkaempfera bronchialis]